MNRLTHFVFHEVEAEALTHALRRSRHWSMLDQWRSVGFLTTLQSDAASAHQRSSLASDKRVRASLPMSCSPQDWGQYCWEASVLCLWLLLLSCAKSHMMSASRRQPHLLHVSAVDRRQSWSMDKSWRCVTLSGFLHSHIVRCRWNPISCGTHCSGPGLSENDSAVTTDVCEDQNREVGLWGLPLKWNWPP